MINVDSFIHRTGRTGRAGKHGRNIVMYDHEEQTIGLDFFQKIEKSIKCNFKYTNTISSEGNGGEDDEKVHEAQLRKLDAI